MFFPSRQQPASQIRITAADSVADSVADSEPRANAEGNVSAATTARRRLLVVVSVSRRSTSCFLQLYAEARTYVIIEMTLEKPLVAKTSPEELARR